MTDPNAIFQHSYYVGNNFNAILYGTDLIPSSPFTPLHHHQLIHAVQALN